MPEQKKVTKHFKRSKIIKIIVVFTIIVCAIFSINSYFSYKNQVFLENYSNAIASIKNKDKKHYKSTFKLLKNLAKDGKATSEDLYYLGYMYQYGLGVNKHYSAAYRCYKKAANSNHAKAYYQLATLYEYGNGVNKDKNKALKFYKRSYQLGYLPAINAIAKILEEDNTLITSTDPKLLYEIYLAYKNNQIKETTQSIKNKYLLASAAKDYEPALLIQARNYSKAGDNYKALMLLQTLLYSSDTTIANAAKAEIPKIKKLIETIAEKKESKDNQQRTTKNNNKSATTQTKHHKKIEYKEKIGRSIPMQKIKNLSGLIFINMSSVNTDILQKFYKDIMGIEIEAKLINNNNLQINYLNNFIKIAHLKNYKSSLFMDFGTSKSPNKFEGLIYYYSNNSNKYINSLINNITKNKARQSSLLPTLTEGEPKPFQQQIKAKKIEKKSHNKQESATNNIKLTHEEQIQRIQIFAQKGDYKKLYELKKIAATGDVYAIYYLGEYYYSEKKYTIALKYFKKAADANYGPAYYKLANLYYDEQQNGIPYNKYKAIKYYKKAANLDVRNAKHILMFIE